jgi:2-furoyl-CoA dehydrogenase FAD binding subunit
MKPGPFDLYFPKTLSEACAVLHEKQGDVRILAGGQTLLPSMGMRVSEPAALIALSRIDELSLLRQTTKVIEVGAMVRQAALEDALKRRAITHPVLETVLPWVAHRPIRQRGTVCGSIAHADPSAELPLAILAMGGSVTAASVRGNREIRAEDLFTGPVQTSLLDDEIIIKASFPLLASSDRIGFAEFGYRHGDFAVVSVLVVAREHSTVFALGGIDDTPVRIEVPSILSERDVISQLTAIASAQTVRNDPTASASFRRHLIVTLGQRACLQMLNQSNAQQEI